MIAASEEWSELAGDWQAVKREPPLLPALLRHVEAHRRRMQWLLLSEVLVIVTALAAIAMLLRTRPSAWPWALYALFFAAGVTAFAVWNRRGTWAATAQTNHACFTLAVLRCRRQLRAATFTVLVTGLHLLAAAVYVLVRDASPERTARGFAMILVYALAYGGGAWYVRARANRELAWLETIRIREEPLT
jgi:hypothetical protein